MVRFAPEISSGSSVDNDGCWKSLETRRLSGGSERGDEEMENLIIRTWRWKGCLGGVPAF